MGLSVLVCLLVCGWAHAQGTDIPPQRFLQQSFGGNLPEAQVLWLTPALKQQTTEILQHPSRMIRTRYWHNETRSAWILDEIGKEKPITIGVLVESGRIEAIRVLAFRESRGWEIRHTFFTDQFQQVGLQQDTQLDRHIDGISGATLSVRAMIKIARLALLFDQAIRP